MSDDSDGQGGGGEPNVSEEMPTLPPLSLGGSLIPHYYGDAVRQIFVVTGAAMLVTAPFLINRAPVLLPFEIGGAIALVCLAALTNPKKTWVLLADVLAAGVGLVVFEALAIAAYASGNWLAFTMLEALTLAFLFALYFSLKTVRSMFLGQIGHRGTYGEFTED